MDERSRVTVIPRDEEAIKKIRKDGWKMWRHTSEDGMPRQRHMSIPEDNWDLLDTPRGYDD